MTFFANFKPQQAIGWILSDCHKKNSSKTFYCPYPRGNEGDDRKSYGNAVRANICFDSKTKLAEIRGQSNRIGEL